MKKGGRGGLLWLTRHATRHVHSERPSEVKDLSWNFWSAAACRRFSFLHDASTRQVRQRLRQHQRAPRNIFWRRVLIRSMAVSIPAGNKKHPRRGDPRYKKGIVISPADHLEKRESVFAAGFGKRPAHFRSAIRRRIRIQQLR